MGWSSNTAYEIDVFKALLLWDYKDIYDSIIFMGQGSDGRLKET